MEVDDHFLNTKQIQTGGDLHFRICWREGKHPLQLVAWRSLRLQEPKKSRKERKDVAKEEEERKGLLIDVSTPRDPVVPNLRRYDWTLKTHIRVSPITF